MSDASTRARGRPRRPATDAAIVQAAVDVIAERGAAAATLSAVAARAGVARATVYLRWPSRDALVGAAARAVTGGRPLALTGDIEQDLEASAELIYQVFRSRQFAALLPEIVRSLTAKPPDVDFDAVAPNRTGLAEQYGRLAASAGFDPAVEPALLFDFIFGAALSHLLATGRGPSRAYMRDVARVVARGLRSKAT